MKRLLYACVVGLLFASSRFVTVKLLGASQDGFLRQMGLILAIPGAFLGWVVANHRLDDINFLLADFANFLFYSGLTYLFLTLATKFRSHGGKR